MTRTINRRTFGTGAAWRFPVLIITLVTLDLATQASISSTLTRFVLVIVVGLTWYGGHNNLVILLRDKMVVKSAYVPWRKKIAIEFEKVKCVYAGRNARFAPATFECLLKDGDTIRFYSSLITGSETKKILAEIEKHNIVVEESITL